ncbi:Heterokaryon incompatibility [Purpureocillium lavendulum]|uniref:Heterokaryon incompatibility n=1 Tax=Purpureocillium lavendulum TaxID=1247861 RepID=A0AB34G253_9HYPO|nr:Heterokaryon incompatibility [Purpureocillium lavendulum]
MVQNPKPEAGGSSSANGGFAPYAYDHIRPGQFRLLSLVQADSLNAPLQGDITCYPISGPPPPAYAALSYVWGTHVDSHAIYLNDRHLAIGANLNSALRHLRRRDRALVLWVDALCINQANVEERNHQVALMRNIYQSAEETIVYLGDQRAGNIATSAWNFLERHSTWALNENQDKDHLLPTRMEALTSFRGDISDVHHDVLSREWFTRVWVIQEAVVSKTVSLQCGRRRVPLDDFFKSAILQERTHERTERVSDSKCFSSRWHKQLTITGAKGASTDLLEMLVRARGLMATNPRDKIFALLGISDGFDWEGYGTIDYGKTTAEVYTAFARDLMMANGDYRALSYLGPKPVPDASTWELLRVAEVRASQKKWRSDILKMAGFQRTSRRPDRGIASASKIQINPDDIIVPSWVPDWTPHQRMHEPKAIIEAVAVRNQDKTAPISAKSPSQLVEKFRAWLPGDVLAVQGRVLGVVDKVMAPSYLLGKDEAAFDTLRAQWKERASSQQYPLEAYILGVWEMILSAGSTLREDPPQKPEPSIATLDGRDALHIPIGKLLERPPWNARKFMKIVLMPEMAAFGDLVAYFPGAKVPFIVRPRSTNATIGKPFRSNESLKRQMRSKLPRLDGSECAVQGHLVGECWINGFDEMMCEGDNEALFAII